MVSFTSCMFSRTSMMCRNRDLKPTLCAKMAMLNRCEAHALGFLRQHAAGTGRGAAGSCRARFRPPCSRSASGCLEQSEQTRSVNVVFLKKLRCVAMPSMPRWTCPEVILHLADRFAVDVEMEVDRLLKGDVHRADGQGKNCWSGSFVHPLFHFLAGLGVHFHDALPHILGAGPRSSWMVSGMTSLRMPSSISGSRKRRLGLVVAVDVHVEQLREFAFVPVGIAEPRGDGGHAVLGGVQRDRYRHRVSRARRK